jgi:hypothetical protein
VLAACGGGITIGSGDFGFNVHVTAGGQVLVNDALVAPGGSLHIVIRAGQSVTVDAGESVFWTLVVGGNAIALDGTDVRFVGADIGATTLSPSTIVVDTFADSQLPAAVPVTLIATSTFDSAQVVIHLLITN